MPSQSNVLERSSYLFPSRGIMSPQVHTKQDCKNPEGPWKTPFSSASNPSYTHTHALHQVGAPAVVLPKTSNTNEVFSRFSDSTEWNKTGFFFFFFNEGFYLLSLFTMSQPTSIPLAVPQFLTLGGSLTCTSLTKQVLRSGKRSDCLPVKE